MFGFIFCVIGWVLLALLGLVLLLLFTPLRVKVRHGVGESGWKISLYLLGVIRIFALSLPAPKSPAPTVKKEPSTVGKTKEKRELPVLGELKDCFRQEGVSGVIDFFQRLCALLGSTLSRLNRFLTVRQLWLNVQIGAQEAEQTARRYGTVCALLMSSISALSSLVRVRQQKVRVTPDFPFGQTDVRLRLVIWVWPFGVLFAGITFLAELQPALNEGRQ